MRFELNHYTYQLTDKEILDDISNVAKKLETDYLSISAYKKHGKFSQTAIQGHFGTWKNALSLAGLRSERNSSELKIISDEDYFSDLRRIAKIIGKETVPYEAYKKYGKYSAEYIIHRFGKWNYALESAGLESTGFTKDRISEQQCFDEIERIWILLGRQPTSTDISKNKLSKYSLDTFKRRFGGWRKALEAFVEYVNSEQTENDCTKKEVKENCAEPLDPCEKYNNNKIIQKNNHRTSRNINARLRFKVMKRDCFKCCACGASPAKDSSVELHVDHIIPWSKGGETLEENLQTLCSKCNLGKSNIL